MLKYNVVPMKNPIDKSVKYYARLVPVTSVTLDSLCEIISRQCTVTVHDVKAVLSALEEPVYQHLRNGNSVRLGDLGSFRPTLRSMGVEQETDFNSSYIQSVSVRFSPSSKLRFELSKQNPAVTFLNAKEVVSGSDQQEDGQ